MKDKLFVSEQCPNCVSIDRQLLRKACDFDEISLDTDSGFALAIYHDVIVVPTLLLENGKRLRGAEEIKQWIKQNQ